MTSHRVNTAPNNGKNKTRPTQNQDTEVNLSRTEILEHNRSAQSQNFTGTNTKSAQDDRTHEMNLLTNNKSIFNFINR